MGDAKTASPARRYYVDAGYSGGSFERPGWKQLIADIDAGLVGTIIAKDLSRIGCYEDRKKYQKLFRAWEKLPEAKRSGFEQRYEYVLRQYRQAVTALRRWQDDGEKIDCKGWKKALDQLNKERFIF